MDIATAFSVAQTLFATLQCAEVRKLCSTFDYESKLQKLLDTVEIIKNCLLDADAKCQELTNEGQYWVQNLKDAIYDADDLMDEFNTIAHQLKGMPGGKISKKVRRFFSSNNQLIFAFDKSNEIKKLRERLDSLARNSRDFGFSDLYKPMKGREETCSYVYEHDIIGRDADKETIVDLLLNDELENNISFVTIVGVGGLGKTALAQLVFSDHRIKEAFKDEMYWVCVSLDFDMKDILGKMIGKNDLGFEDLHKKVRNTIEGKRFLLVLDDVWSEDGQKWDELKSFLNLGGRGTKILVTSRSRKVAGAIGRYQIHNLQGLSNEDSWKLFKKISLEQMVDEAGTGLVEIGKDILKKCANVPLSIRVIASLLRNQDIATWHSLKSIDLADMCGDEDRIMPTLMFSYYHLAPELKSCFCFCSLFPEDHVIDKTELIQLWMAQGYLIPSAKNESMEDVGEKYISILLHRCFFQDTSLHKSPGEVLYFKMHDLMHELARKVAAKDSTTLTACRIDYEGKACHLFNESNGGLTTGFRSSNYLTKKLRTYLRFPVCPTSNVNAIISNCICLRVLDLKNSLTTRNLPDKLGKLLHLRYLDLSKNYELEMLPKSITKLYNLQTLKLIYCVNLKELPEDTSKLVNLRVLDIDGCKSMTHMPAGMGKLTSLHTLTMFTVCADDDDLKQDKKGKLIDLIAPISNLRGHLYFRHFITSINESFNKFMIVKLDSLNIYYDLDCYHKGQKKLLEVLFFYRQSRKLSIKYYSCTNLPSWSSGLVSIKLSYCKDLLCLPSPLSQLCHLKYLCLWSMKNMEYIESDAPSPSAKFFPCLEELELKNMPAFKGWWRDIRWIENETVFIPSFPRLCKLYIFHCKRLTYIPQCPYIKQLHLESVKEALTFSKKEGGLESNPIYLNELTIDNSCAFISLFREGLESCTSSLRKLVLLDCRGMENLGIEHLTNLKYLTLKRNTEVIPWESLHSLSSLKSLEYLFLDCRKLKSLPEEICHLTSLTTLVVHNCRELKSLPEAIKHLTSLNTLVIEDCPELKSLPESIKHLTFLNRLEIEQPSPELKDRCQEPNGEDWLKICHIPTISVTRTQVPISDTETKGYLAIEFEIAEILSC